ncbi:unnamed protein product, partial [Rotaria sordida]
MVADLKSLHINNDFPSPIPNEEELLKRITDDSPYRSQSPTTSLSSLTPRTKLTRQTNNNPTNSLMNKRERLLNISVEPPVKSRSTTPSLLSFNHLPNSSQSNNQSVSSITKTSIESTLGSKSAKNSNPDISLKKSIN